MPHCMRRAASLAGPPPDGTNSEHWNRRTPCWHASCDKHFEHRARIMPVWLAGADAPSPSSSQRPQHCTAHKSKPAPSRAPAPFRHSACMCRPEITSSAPGSCMRTLLPSLLFTGGVGGRMPDLPPASSGPPGASPDGCRPFDDAPSALEDAPRARDDDPRALEDRELPCTRARRPFGPDAASAGVPCTQGCQVRSCSHQVRPHGCTCKAPITMEGCVPHSRMRSHCHMHGAS